MTGKIDPDGLEGCDGCPYASDLVSSGISKGDCNILSCKVNTFLLESDKKANCFPHNLTSSHFVTVTIQGVFIGTGNDSH